MKLFFSLPDQASLLRAMWPVVRRYWPYWLGVAVSMPLSVGMAVLVPYLTKLAIDDYIVPASETGQVAPVWEPLLTLAAIMAAVVVVGYLADALYVSVLQRAGHSLIADLRGMLFDRTLRLPRTYFDTHPIGTILTRVTSDFEAIQEGLASGVLTLFMEMLKSVGYLTIMFFLNWRLTLVLLIVFPVLVLLVHTFQSRIRRHFFRARQALSDATGFLQESLNGMKTVQLFGAEKKVLRTFVEKNAHFLHSQNRSNLYDALLFSLVEGVTTLSLALVLWYAAGELLAGAITLGVLVAFIEYINRLFVPVREFSQQVAVLQRALAAVEHINDLFEAPLDPAEDEAPSARAAANRPAAGRPPAALPPPPATQPLGAIEFDKVRYRYSGTAPEVLKGVTFTVAQGETLAIVGPTGSGKSTLIRLLTRAYSGYEGSIRIGGRELCDIPVEQLGRTISVVHQNVFLFQGSVSFNIGLERAEVSRQMIEDAARYVNAHGFISRLEGGYDFRIAQGGSNLSTGQGQLIALARAVAAQTELIVLDEATASVDSITEHWIQQALERLYHDKTVIAIAHRLSTIREADTIVVLAQGEVAEMGNHQALMARGGLYAGLVGELESPPPPESPAHRALG
ncbi:MAG: ABC transporter ATP-binding protein [SAR324 cluster bacterium]|nr:ABC transporter ATP-binding protein [SAR324 cluster bacterium]